MLTTEVYPPISDEDLKKEEELSAARELEWLVNNLQETISSLRSALEECLALLQPQQPGCTLVLSTSRSESLKGFITRVGNQIVKGEIHIKMHGIHNTKGSNSFRLQIASQSTSTDSDRRLLLAQLIDARNYVLEALDSLPTSNNNNNNTIGQSNGGETDKEQEKLPVTDAKWMLEHLSSLRENVRAAKTALSTTVPSHLFPFRALDPKIFDPPLPPNLSFDLSIVEAALVAELRSLEHLDPHHPSLCPSSSSKDGTDPSSTTTSTSNPFSALKIFDNFNNSGSSSKMQFKDRFAFALGGKKPVGEGEEAGKVYTYRGAEVRVRERVRVESQDPSLMSVLAKLGALENNVMLAEKTLRVGMYAAGRL